MSGARFTRSLPGDLRVRDSTRLLAIVMGLPLVDGIFPALVLSGALASVVGVVQVGLLVFGGSATVAVLLSSREAPLRKQALAVLAVGVPLVALAAVEAALAPVIGSVLDLAIFERFAAVVLLTVAAETASARVREYLPRPALVVALGVVASVDLASIGQGVTPRVVADPTLVASAAAAAAVGVAFALVVVALRARLAAVVDVDRFRFGSAVALGVLSLTVLGVVPSSAPLPLAVLALAAVLAFDPAGEEADAEEATDEEEEAETPPVVVDSDHAPWM